MLMLEYHLALTCVTKKIKHTNCVSLVRKLNTVFALSSKVYSSTLLYFVLLITEIQVVLVESQKFFLNLLIYN